MQRWNQPVQSKINIRNIHVFNIPKRRVDTNNFGSLRDYSFTSYCYFNKLQMLQS